MTASGSRTRGRSLRIGLQNWTAPDAHCTKTQRTHSRLDTSAGRCDARTESVSASKFDKCFRGFPSFFVFFYHDGTQFEGSNVKRAETSFFGTTAMGLAHSDIACSITPRANMRPIFAFIRARELGPAR